MLTCVVGVTPDQHERNSCDSLQRTGNLVNSSHSQLTRTDVHVDREKHSDEILNVTEEGRVEQEVKEKGEKVYPKAYHIDKSPVGPLKESYDSPTEENPQNIGHGIEDDSSDYKKKRERDAMHGNETARKGSICIIFLLFETERLTYMS